MNKKINRLVMLCMVWLIGQIGFAQYNIYTRYIEDHKKLAIEQMRKHDIPASITLAQGLLESAAGTSYLAREANNHFGIKCHADWRGKFICVDDDKKGEHFRVYRTVEDSYEDHSLFLKRSRYAPLFSLNITDYKGWAHGLKKCGYATNPQYAQLLINIIERFELYQYDCKKGRTEKQDKDMMSGGHILRVLRCNECYYVIAQQGDTWESIARGVGKSARKLRRYNEVSKYDILTEGDIVYLEKKRKKASKDLKGYVHVVQKGESLHRISQLYGIRVETLYDINCLDGSYQLTEGDALRIR